MEEIEPCSDAKPRAMKESGAASTSAPITHSSEGATSGSANGQAAAMETPSSNKRPRREVKAVSYAESNAVDEDADDDVIKRGKHDESASNSACSVEPGGNGATETTFRAQHRRRQYCDPVVGDRVLKYFGGFGRYEGTIVSVRGPVPQPIKAAAAPKVESPVAAVDSKSTNGAPLDATAPNPGAQDAINSANAVDGASSSQAAPTQGLAAAGAAAAAATAAAAAAAAMVSPGGEASTRSSSNDPGCGSGAAESSNMKTPEGSSTSSNARKLWLVVFDDGDAEEYELSDCAQLVRWHSDRDDFEDYVLANHYGRGGNGGYSRGSGSYGGRGPKASRLDALSVDAALSLKTTPIFLKQENPKKLNTKSWKRYEIYKAATTVEEYLSLGGLKADVKFDYQRSYLAVVDLTTGNKQWVERTEGPNGEDLSSDGLNESGDGPLQSGESSQGNTDTGGVDGGALVSETGSSGNPPSSAEPPAAPL